MIVESWKNSLIDELAKLRIHLVIAHDVKKNKDCKNPDKSHWNTELSAIVDKLRELEEEDSTE